MKKTLAAAVIAALTLLGTVQAASATVPTVAVGVRLAHSTQTCHNIVIGDSYRPVCSLRGTFYVAVSGVVHGCVGTGTAGPGDVESFACANHTRFSRTSIPWHGSYAYSITLVFGAHTYRFEGYPRSVPRRPGDAFHWTFRAQRF